MLGETYQFNQYLLIDNIDYIIQKKSLDQLNKISYFDNNFNREVYHDLVYT